MTELHLLRCYLSLLADRFREARADERGSLTTEQAVITGGLVLMAAAAVLALGAKVVEKIGSINL